MRQHRCRSEYEGLLTTVHLQLNHILTSILPKSRREAEEHNTRTSYIEYEVDASVLKADEGRGDRRNVQGELQASDEP